MTWPSLVCQPAVMIIGDQDWLRLAIGIAGAGVLLTVLLNRRRLAAVGLATLLRVCGWLLISACLVNPLWSRSFPRQGANVFAVVVDNSRSQNVQMDGRTTRAEFIAARLERAERVESRGWLQRLDEHFELRRYQLSSFLQQTPDYLDLQFEGDSSRILSGLDQLRERYQGQPLAGVLLISDGNATDADGPVDERGNGPPIFPVIRATEDRQPDLAIESVTTSLSAFDDAPVTFQIQLQRTGSAGTVTRTTVLAEDGTPVESVSRDAQDDSPIRLNVRPQQAGTVFYRVQTELRDDAGAVIEEATTVNNSRLLAVDRGSEPRRILYVSGRPNWEFKFLRRAIDTDPQTRLIGLIRIARREAKFEFRGQGSRANSLFRGFDEAEQEVAEEYDEPVLVRLGTDDEDELISGFPDAAADLFAFDGLILDDIEAAFFSADQQQLIREFVSRRGGGVLMLGGQESFRQGAYDRTPVGEILPLDLRQEAPAAAGPVRLTLTREGWLQPWVRLRTAESDERTRLQDMPGFETLNPAFRVRPGAQVMATVADADGQEWPALVVQRFGRGRSAAMCVGDLWRWRMHEGRLSIQSALDSLPVAGDSLPSDDGREDRGDYSRAARQMLRWLVSDVPRRLDVTSRPANETGVHAWRISATVRDRRYAVREDAQVVFQVTDPSGRVIEKPGRPADDELGRFDVIVTAAQPGAWNCRVTAVVQTEDGPAEELTARHGFASQPAQQEMAAIGVNHRILETVAGNSGGRVIPWEQLDEFVDQLPNAEAPVMETRSWPVWNQWSVFLAAVLCFAGDWALRRRQGWP